MIRDAGDDLALALEVLPAPPSFSTNLRTTTPHSYDVAFTKFRFKLPLMSLNMDLPVPSARALGVKETHQTLSILARLKRLCSVVPLALRR
jgi:hypothetical protein